MPKRSRKILKSEGRCKFLSLFLSEGGRPRSRASLAKAAGGSSVQLRAEILENDYSTLLLATFRRGILAAPREQKQNKDQSLH